MLNRGYAVDSTVATDGTRKDSPNCFPMIIASFEIDHAQPLYLRRPEPYSVCPSKKQPDSD